MKNPLTSRTMYGIAGLATVAAAKELPAPVEGGAIDAEPVEGEIVVPK